MNFSGKSKAKLPEFQFTAMIDVVFLLLCFFITTTVFSQWEYEVDLVLPTAKSGEMPDRLPGEVIVNITRDGTISINQTVLSRDQLQSRLNRLVALYPGQPIIVRADRATPYENLMAVIDICRLADIWNISFATSSDDEVAAEK